MPSPDEMDFIVNFTNKGGQGMLESEDGKLYTLRGIGTSRGTTKQPSGSGLKNFRSSILDGGTQDKAE